MDSYYTEPLGPGFPLISLHANYTEPSLRKLVRLNPTAIGKAVRYTLVIDIVLNISMALAMTLFTRWLLGPIVMHPSTINSIMISICQWIGIIILAFITQVVLAIPNTRSAIETWRLVYWTLLASKCFLVPLFLY